MYRKVTAYTKDQEQKKGMIEQVRLSCHCRLLVLTQLQSLCHFLHHELSEYHRLLAVLESQMTGSGPSSDSESTTMADGTGLTLLRLGLWTGEMQLKIKMMVEVVEDAKSLCTFRTRRL